MDEPGDIEVAISAVEAGATVVRVKYGAAVSRYDKSPTDSPPKRIWKQREPSSTSSAPHALTTQ